MHLRRLWRAQTILRQAATASGGKIRKGGGSKERKTKKTAADWLRWIRASRKISGTRLILSLLLLCLGFVAKHLHLTSVYRCCFKSRLGSRVEACDWTPRAAPELYFEEETTEPQIMLHSPLGSTTVITVCFFLFSSHFVRYSRKASAFQLSPHPQRRDSHRRKKQGPGCPVRGRWTINQRKWKTDFNQSGMCRKMLKKN